jgi:hypothetical protein
VRRSGTGYPSLSGERRDEKTRGACCIALAERWLGSDEVNDLFAAVWGNPEWRDFHPV